MIHGWLCEGYGQGDKLKVKEEGVSQGSNGDGELMRDLRSSWARERGDVSLMGYLMAPPSPYCGSSNEREDSIKENWGM